MSDMDAERYRARRDQDDDDWGDPLPPSETPKLDTMISARFTSDEADLVRAAADRLGSSLSEFVRRAAMAAAIGSRNQAVIGGFSTITSTSSDSPETTSTGSGGLDPVLTGTG